LSTLQTTLASRLDRTDWSEASLKEMEALLPELDALAPGRAQEARQRLHGRLEAHLYEQLKRARIPAGDAVAIEAKVRLLAERAPGAVAPFRAALGRRLRDWEPVFELK